MIEESFDLQLKKFVSHFTGDSCNFLSEVEDEKYPKVSIVMPLYNQVDYVERSILSVLNQNYPNLEFILIDGGSTDGGVEIIKKYEKYLAYWTSEPDNGQSDALNKGFKRATGTIVGWLNGDDLYLPDAIKCAVNELVNRNDKSIVFGDYLTIDKEDNIMTKEFAFDFSLGQFIYEGFHLNAQAMFWRREAHLRFGQFESDLHRTMDYDMILRLGICEGEKSFLRLPITLGCFRRHEAQKTQGYDSVVDAEHRAIALKNNCDLKYSRWGRWIRLFYRIRRLRWYFKRAGISYVAAKLFRKVQK